MELIEWNEQKMGLGILPLDRQHQEVIAIGYELSLLDDNSTPVYKKTLKKFILAIRFHFKSEEDLFQRFHYPNEAQHKQAHTQLLEKLSRLYKNPALTSAQKVRTYLSQWFEQHIQSYDKEYTDFFKNNNILLVDDFFLPIETAFIVEENNGKKKKVVRVKPKFNNMSDQHRAIITTIQQLKDLNKTGISTNRVLLSIPKILDQLDDCGTFFPLEESLMEKKGYPYMDAHMKMHEEFLKKVDSFRSAFQSLKGDISEEILIFLQQWAKNHILEEDQKFKLY